jgi:hypothetical protein
MSDQKYEPGDPNRIGQGNAGGAVHAAAVGGPAGAPLMHTGRQRS